jgi:spore maturation protein SpmA
MKTVLEWFCIITACGFLAIATGAFITLTKKVMACKETTNEMAMSLIGIIGFWFVGGLFLFFAYLFS